MYCGSLEETFYNQENVTADKSMDIIQANDQNKQLNILEIESFSALTSSLRPIKHSKVKCSESEDYKDYNRHNGYFDEFGFWIDSKTDPILIASKESAVNRRIWLTCLEFSYTHTLGVSNIDECDSPNSLSLCAEDDQFWSRVNPSLVFSPRLTDLIRGGANDLKALIKPDELYGVPHSLRPQIWPRLTGALVKARNAQQQNPPVTYTELTKLSSTDSLLAGVEIERDLLRMMPNNVCFYSVKSTGISRLRRILRAIAWLYVDVGYCQSIGIIAANLLLCLEEEYAFWMMCAIIEDLLPPSYFSSISLLGVQADQLVLTHLLPFYLPELDALFKEYEIDLPLVTLQWFLTLYSKVCSTALTFRIWDLFFYEGSIVLFRIALALLSLKKDELLLLTNSAQLFNILSNAPASVTNINEFIQFACNLDDEQLEPSNINNLRRHYMAQLMMDDGLSQRLSFRSNLPRQYLLKRQLKPTKPLFASLWNFISMSNNDDYNSSNNHNNEGFDVNIPFACYPFDRNDQTCLTNASVKSRFTTFTSIGTNSPDKIMEMDDPKLKNVIKTEILIELKQSIHMIVKHFRNNDPQHSNATSQADYSMSSHKNDLDAYIKVLQHTRKKVKALIDFECLEPDELGFSKNDIITLINSDDEHCWIGEIGNKCGWFPASYVEPLDERGKHYSPAGDDAVNSSILSLVRGSLCQSLGAIFSHGFRRPRLLSEFHYHPWQFIVEAASKQVEKDYNSVYSRLSLCKTFRLDEEGKVLSPEEVLFSAVHNINMSHDLANSHMDVKFRSLICYGLNEQLLHLWFEILCSSEEAVQKWYYPHSYVRSPGWVQIKCELRLLRQFPFHLSLVSELNNANLKSENRRHASLLPYKTKTNRSRTSSNCTHLNRIPYSSQSAKNEDNMTSSPNNNNIDDNNNSPNINSTTSVDESQTVRLDSGQQWTKQSWTELSDSQRSRTNLSANLPTSVDDTDGDDGLENEHRKLDGQSKNSKYISVDPDHNLSNLQTNYINENAGNLLVKYHLFSWEL